jgi:tetratricopeptide (TPR) repeat protein
MAITNSIISTVAGGISTLAFRRIRFSQFLCSMALLLSVPAMSQTAQDKTAQWNGHLVWVLPFENNSATPGVDWIGASFPDIMNQRLSSAGFLTIRREDRRYALQHLGLPADFHPTQATAYRIAQTLDADFVVFGNYTITNGQLNATARVLRMHGPSMSPTIREQGDLNQLIQIEDSLTWKVAMEIDPGLNLDEQTFVAASRGLRLDAFENYIRGLVEPGIDERLGHLNKAVQLSPNYTQAWFALGKTYFENQQYEEAETALSKVPVGGRLSLEARFYIGLSDLYTGNYAKAQAEFAAIASFLPMPEVLNNEGVAANRRGENGTAFFQRVVQLDPQNADYWFNLAVSQRRQKNYSAALKSVANGLVIRPEDEEARNLRQNLLLLENGTLPQPLAVSASNQHEAKATVPSNQPTSTDSSAVSDSGDDAASSSQDSPGNSHAANQPDSAENSGPDSPDYEPLERIARGYNESSLRQAAFSMEQMGALKLRSLPPVERAKKLYDQGQVYVRDGLLLEAERQFQLALSADPKSAEAYAGLAEVHQYAGNAEIAGREANKSLQLQPNVAAYLVLARIALAEHSFTAARDNAEHALKLEPNDTAAKGILLAIQAQQTK